MSVLGVFLQHHCKTGVLIIGKMKPSFVFIYFDCLVLITAEIYLLWVRDISDSDHTSTILGMNLDRVPILKIDHSISIFDFLLPSFATCYSPWGVWWNCKHHVGWLYQS